MASLTPITPTSDRAAKPTRAARAGLLGAVVAAFAASACCILPAVLAVVGLSGVGLAAALEPYRPIFLGGTVLLLGAGFYLTYRRPRRADPEPACETECGVCEKPRVARSGKWMLWIATVLVAVFAAYPYAAGAFAETTARGSAERTADATTVRIRVEGMTCKACATGIAAGLAEVDGVVDAKVEYEQGYAVVTYDPARVAPEALVPVIDDLGYRATVAR
ncbi:MAG: cation transporter [Dehalococcoidia bacterium]|nr:cation transporter [Dehalococcoidia bacterium]MCB9508185.1 cation transporter [Myxococcales bacterium]